MLDLQREIEELGTQIESSVDVLDGDRMIDEGADNIASQVDAERRGDMRESQ